MMMERIRSRGSRETMTIVTAAVLTVLLCISMSAALDADTVSIGNTNVEIMIECGAGGTVGMDLGAIEPNTAMVANAEPGTVWRVEGNELTIGTDVYTATGSEDYRTPHWNVSGEGTVEENSRFTASFSVKGTIVGGDGAFVWDLTGQEVQEEYDVICGCKPGKDETMTMQTPSGEVTLFYNTAVTHTVDGWTYDPDYGDEGIMEPFTATAVCTQISSRLIVSCGVGGTVDGDLELDPDSYLETFMEPDASWSLDGNVMTVSDSVNTYVLEAVGQHPGTVPEWNVSGSGLVKDVPSFDAVFRVTATVVSGEGGSTDTGEYGLYCGRTVTISGDTAVLNTFDGPVTLTAVPDEGYSFGSWVAEPPDSSRIVEQCFTLTAEFVKDPDDEPAVVPDTDPDDTDPDGTDPVPTVVPGIDPDSAVPGTTVNPDGSVTEITINPDGSILRSTVYEDGILKELFNPDGSFAGSLDVHIEDLGNGKFSVTAVGRNPYGVMDVFRTIIGIEGSSVSVIIGSYDTDPAYAEKAMRIADACFPGYSEYDLEIHVKGSVFAGVTVTLPGDTVSVLKEHPAGLRVIADDFSVHLGTDITKTFSGKLVLRAAAVYGDSMTPGQITACEGYQAYRVSLEIGSTSVSEVGRADMMLPYHYGQKAEYVYSVDRDGGTECLEATPGPGTVSFSSGRMSLFAPVPEIEPVPVPEDNSLITVIIVIVLALAASGITAFLMHRRG